MTDDTMTCPGCGGFKCPDANCPGEDCPECGGFVCLECGGGDPLDGVRELARVSPDHPVTISELLPVIETIDNQAKAIESLAGIVKRIVK